MQVLQNLMGLFPINLIKADLGHLWYVVYKSVKATQAFPAFKKKIEMGKGILFIYLRQTIKCSMCALQKYNLP